MDEVNRSSLEGFQYYLNCLNDDVDIPINAKFLARIIKMALKEDLDDEK